MYEKIKRIKSWFKGRKKGPLSLELNPTNLCNLSCKFCHGFQGGLTQKEAKELDQGICTKIIEEASNLNVREVHIAGDGEPLAKISLLKSLIENIKKHKMIGTLTTNGTLFTLEIIKLMVKLDWNLITISLEGSDAKTHDHLTGNKGSYKRIIRNVNLFNEYKIRLKKEKPLIKFSTIILEKNKQQLSKIIELAHKLNVRSVSFEPLITHNDPKIEKLEIKKNEFNKLRKEIKKIKELADKYKISTNIEFIDKSITVKKTSDKNIKKIAKESQLPYCYQSWYKIVVRPDGQVQPCCNFYDNNAENIYKKSLKEIWYGQHFTEIRKNLINNKPYKCCENCNAWIIQENEEIKKTFNNPFIISKIGLKECLKSICETCLKI